MGELEQAAEGLGMAIIVDLTAEEAAIEVATVVVTPAFLR